MAELREFLPDVLSCKMKHGDRWVDGFVGILINAAGVEAYRSPPRLERADARKEAYDEAALRQWLIERRDDPEYLRTRSALLAVDITFVRSEQATDPANNFANIGFVVNADGYGFTSQGNPLSVTPFVGQGSPTEAAGGAGRGFRRMRRRGGRGFLARCRGPAGDAGGDARGARFRRARSTRARVPARP